MNSQQRAAMQMALEALEKATMVYEANDTHPLTWKAITALREALAQPQGCHHRIADARNPIVKSGYMCVDCGALFSAADHTIQPVVPDGYALISIDALKAWGKHEKVSNACCYPIHEPVVPQGEPVAGSDDDTDKAAELGWHLQAQIEAAIEATKEKATKVCDDLYKHDRKDSGYDEGWNDALGTAEQAIRSMK